MNTKSRFQKIESPTLQSLVEKLQAMPEDQKLQLGGEGSDSLGAWFLGTKGENIPLFRRLIEKSITAHEEARKTYYPEDPAYVTEEVQSSESFQQSVSFMEKELDKLLKQLQDSGPFWSMRSIGHMLWDTSVPGLLGYFAALLYNQNNVAAEASPVTTILELEVGNDLCKMLGYKIQPITPGESNSQEPTSIPDKDDIVGWGHITCDGSVANTEGLWMSRNLKFYPVALKAAIQESPELAPAKGMMVILINGIQKPLVEATNWELLNLPIDEVLNLALKINLTYQIPIDTIGNVVNNYSIQELGLFEFYKKYLPDIDHAPISFAPSTKHYSWPKAASLLGMGSGFNVSILVDDKARMRVDLLEQHLQKCVDKKQPVTTVIAVIGTTEESAVDPLADILQLREKFRQKGLEFTIHADAAWGGYFASMLRKNDHTAPEEVDDAFVPSLPMSKYVIEQYKALGKADSITIDPHKAGYIPYPAGGLCYRNSAMRNMVSFTAPVVFHGGIDPTVGVYGVEGSKPGAAAAATYLSHRVIRPDSTGYGQILGECYFTAKKFYANLQCLNLDRTRPFIVVPLAELPAIEQGGSIADGIRQMEFMKERIIEVSNEELIQDTEAMALLKEMGQDQTIITYMFNFKNQDGSLNTDTQKMSDLNNEVYRRLSFKPFEDPTEQTPLVVTSSNFSVENYGVSFIQKLRTRLGVQGGEDVPINFIISTVMNPWLTATEKGSFLPTFMEILSDTVEGIIREIWAGDL